jgi:hypothetical protein
VSRGVNFMSVRLKIILIGTIKGKDHKISLSLYYLCSRNKSIYRSVQKLLNQHKGRGVLDLKKYYICHDFVSTFNKLYWHKLFINETRAQV